MRNAINRLAAKYRNGYIKSAQESDRSPWRGTVSEGGMSPLISRLMSAGRRGADVWERRVVNPVGEFLYENHPWSRDLDTLVDKGFPTAPDPMVFNAAKGRYTRLSDVYMTPNPETGRLTQYRPTPISEDYLTQLGNRVRSNARDAADAIATGSHGGSTLDRLARDARAAPSLRTPDWDLGDIRQPAPDPTLLQRILAHLSRNKDKYAIGGAAALGVGGLAYLLGSRNAEKRRKKKRR